MWQGLGAEEFGGRWNEKGMRMVYASDSPSLAAMEVLVHLRDADALYRNYVLSSIDIPTTLLAQLAAEDLPANWRDHPPPTSTQEIGSQFVAAAGALGLLVPSVIVPMQQNILINPGHAAFESLLADSLRIEPFEFDGRLIKRT
jgi:RES domain-containing protein